MKKQGIIFLPFLLMGSLMVNATLASADVALIANKSITTDALTDKEAKKVFLARIKVIAGGGTIRLADLPIGNPTRKDFYKNVIKKKEAQLKAYWAKKSFTGKAFPPKIFDSADEVLEWVAQTKGAMGYVPLASVNDTVKVLLKK